MNKLSCWRYRRRALKACRLGGEHERRCGTGATATSWTRGRLPRQVRHHAGPPDRSLPDGDVVGRRTGRSRTTCAPRRTTGRTPARPAVKTAPGPPASTGTGASPTEPESRGSAAGAVRERPHPEALATADPTFATVATRTIRWASAAVTADFLRPTGHDGKRYTTGASPEARQAVGPGARIHLREAGSGDGSGVMRSARSLMRSAAAAGAGPTGCGSGHDVGEAWLVLFTTTAGRRRPCSPESF